MQKHFNDIKHCYGGVAEAGNSHPTLLQPSWFMSETGISYRNSVRKAKTTEATLTVSSG